MSSVIKVGLKNKNRGDFNEKSKISQPTISNQGVKARYTKSTVSEDANLMIDFCKAHNRPITNMHFERRRSQSTTLTFPASNNHPI